jgi:Na+/H+-dicarboxylate symporter
LAKKAARVAAPKSRRLSLATLILIGLVAGIATGLFFGDYCEPLRIVGNAFIAMLQMTVLPYIILALIVNIGGLTLERARNLARWAGLMLLAFWAIGICVAVTVPLAFPDLTTASFFSTALIEAPTQVDYLKLYIPSNPFHSMANSLIPAVVLFSIAVGIALIAMREKAGLIRPLAVLLDAMARINAFVIKLTPVGVFGIAASAAGTLTLDEIGRLQAYLITYIGSAVLLTFWVLPSLVASFTPFGHRDVMRVARTALVTAFATGNVFIVLPLLVAHAKTLFEKYRIEHKEVGPSIDVVLPVGFTFPTLGKLLTLVFVPFAAWFVGSEMSVGQYAQLVVSGLLSYFGAVSLALPFLLDLMRIPSDMFQLYLLAGIAAGRFGALLSAMGLLALAVLTACAMTGTVVIRRRQLMTCVGSAGAVLLVFIIATRVYLDRAMEGQYKKDEIIAAMQLLEDPVTSVVLAEASPNPVPLRGGQSRLERIRERGVIRVGFEPDSMPFAHFNRGGQLVGFDVDMAHDLARGLGLQIEFVPFQLGTLTQQLAEDHFDLAMSGIPGSVSLYEEVMFTDPYLDVTPALVVKDYLRKKRDTLQEFRTIEGLTLGVINDRYILERIRSRIPNARVVAVDSPRSFFEGELADLDALAIDAESGSAWTLLYPEYAVVTLSGLARQWPLGYAVAGQDLELLDFMNHWINLKKKDGTIEGAYDHWILGRTAEQKGPRWSIIRDVLHWVE